MLAEHKTNTNIGIGGGLILQFLGRTLDTGFSMLIIITGSVLFIWGCTQYAKGKGYSAWFGLLGLISFFGLIILALLPDKHS